MTTTIGFPEDFYNWAQKTSCMCSRRVKEIRIEQPHTSTAQIPQGNSLMKSHIKSHTEDKNYEFKEK